MCSDLNNIIKNWFCSAEQIYVNQIKIDHYSWPENSIYRFFDKEVVNEQLLRQAEIAVENEFLKWDDEYAKQVMIESLSFMRCDKNIPSYDAWEDIHTFENKALKSLQLLIRNNPDVEITDIVRIAESALQKAKIQNDMRYVQIFERILYELQECSLREFDELKRVSLNGEK